MNYTLTQHAIDVIQEREINLAWIEKILAHPSLIEKDKEDINLVHHLGKIPEIEHRVLRLVVNKTVEPIRVITVYFDRKMKGKL